MALQTMGIDLCPFRGGMWLSSRHKWSSLISRESKLDRGESSAIRAPSKIHWGTASSGPFESMYQLSKFSMHPPFLFGYLPLREDRKGLHKTSRGCFAALCCWTGRPRSLFPRREHGWCAERLWSFRSNGCLKRNRDTVYRWRAMRGRGRVGPFGARP